MIIGVDASRATSGGAQILLWELFNDFTAGDFGTSEIQLWVSSPVAVPPVNSGVVVRRVPGPQKPMISALWWQAFKLPKEASKSGCDVLVSMESATPARFSQHVVVLQDVLAYEAREWLRAGFPRGVLRQLALRMLHSKALRGASLAIAPTHYAGMLARKKFSMTNFAVLEPRPLTSTSRSELHGKSLPLTAVYVSHGANYKNHKNLLIALTILRDSSLEVRLKFVGSFTATQKNALYRQMSKLRIPLDRVDFAGELGAERVALEVEKSDFVLFASRAESLSYSLLEAIRSGRPIACSASSALPEVLRRDGVYFDANNPVSIANACRMVAVDLQSHQGASVISNAEDSKARGLRIRSDFFAAISDLLAKDSSGTEAP